MLVICFRGCGDSEGDFSLGGWLDDLKAASDFLHGVDDVGGVWMAGFGTGGALTVCAAADDSAGPGRGRDGRPGRLRRLGQPPPAAAAARP